MKELMKSFSEAYYRGEPIISNEEYDALEKLHGQVIAGEGDINHLYRMFSLKKHYAKDGELPLNKQVCARTPKLDGAAVSIVYIDGKLNISLTRGDGIKGRDITDKIRLLDNIPTTIPCSIAQITGEVVARKDIENSRNYASGALNLKSLDDFLQRKTDGDMIFVAYNIQVAQNRWGSEESYTKDLALLGSWGFNVINQKDYESVYPTDGEVYRLNNNNTFNAEGFTDKFPRGAIALKEEQEGVVTKLLDVQWATGKSGKVTPVAILETVNINGANISKATLNNIAFIEAMDLEIGCLVKVIRSGEIIPKIVGKVTNE